jgi:hypothetical protein
LSKARHEEDHPDTLNTMLNLAGVLIDKGQLAAAEGLLCRTVAGYKAASGFGETHPTTSKAIGWLAGVRQKLAAEKKAKRKGGKKKGKKNRRR